MNRVWSLARLLGWFGFRSHSNSHFPYLSFSRFVSLYSSSQPIQYITLVHRSSGLLECSRYRYQNVQVLYDKSLLNSLILLAVCTLFCGGLPQCSPFLTHFRNLYHSLRHTFWFPHCVIVKIFAQIVIPYWVLDYVNAIMKTSSVFWECVCVCVRERLFNE